MRKKFPTIKETNRHHEQVINSSSDLSIKGYYMKITLEHLFINLILNSKYSNNTKEFTAIIVLFENIWDYRIDMDCCLNGYFMIDADSFQHKTLYDLGEFNKVERIKSPGFIENALPEYQRVLEGHAKSRGTFLFNRLSGNIHPQRFIFRFNIFDPGQIEGTVRDTETFEFIFPTEESIKLIHRQTIYDGLITV